MRARADKGSRNDARVFGVGDYTESFTLRCDSKWKEEEAGLKES